ncbi:transposase family protein [Streptomyces adustus]|uniref:transposase family protein n=1 Tax=Streptomyces adustus TaxID=1609272 RepID=UPI0035DC2700
MAGGDVPRACPGCGQVSDRVHSRNARHVADKAVGGRPVLIDLSVRRLYCEWPDCPKATLVEQVEELTERYQRRTPALRRIVTAAAVALAGSAGARLLSFLHCTLSWATVLNCLMRVPVADRGVPQVIGIDGFALRRGHHYAGMMTDAGTGKRTEVLRDRKNATVTAWLREHPGSRVACRDGAAGFAQAVTDADPTIVQVADRRSCASPYRFRTSSTLSATCSAWMSRPLPLGCAYQGSL